MGPPKRSDRAGGRCPHARGCGRRPRSRGHRRRPYRGSGRDAWPSCPSGRPSWRPWAFWPSSPSWTSCPWSVRVGGMPRRSAGRSGRLGRCPGSGRPRTDWPL
eukprot:7393944-Alexandrium_andersonii.AAC.1